MHRITGGALAVRHPCVRDLDRLVRRGGRDGHVGTRKQEAAPPEIRAIFEAGKAAYVNFVSSLLSITDNLDGEVSFLDVVYFTMISITTTGFGDIAPISDRARLVAARCGFVAAYLDKHPEEADRLE